MNDHVFSQSESKLIADYLRYKHGIRANGLAFWRKSPTEAAAFVNKVWPNFKETAQALHDAAGRSKMGVPQ
jgi:hypothetical protein